MGLAIRNDSVTPRLAMVLQLGSEVLVRAGYGLGIYTQITAGSTGLRRRAARSQDVQTIRRAADPVIFNFV
jgi:hypothetical protein